MPDLLYEIGTEELPASYIRPALEQLRRSLEKELDEAEIVHGDILSTGTSRRLVLAAKDLAEHQPDVDEAVTGPPVQAAFDGEGRPTRAAEGFARSHGVEVGAIQRTNTPRGEYCVIHRLREGRPTVELLAEILPRITRQVSFPKSMLWPNSRCPFARPVRSLTALLGTEVVAFALCSVETGRSVEAHPILAPGRLTLENADFDNYQQQLRNDFVVVDMAERRQDIRRRIEAALANFGGTLTEEELLDEVTNLVQYPSVTVGDFDPAFLEVPDSVVEAAMMEHQRYFPVRDGEGHLSPHFIVVSDRGPQPSEVVRVGNEQVLKARLADAQFFYQVDRKIPLADRVAGLDGVQFLKGLGTYRDKCRRLEKLVKKVAEALGLDDETAAHAQRAAGLCKADLLTAMVGEFPKLQGEVGRIYALNEGEPEAVAQAIAEHYLPKSAGGPLPSSPAGRALGLAEKLDNLTACFALSLIPTGSADPYAMRRQAQAALRTIAESGRHLRISALLQMALILLPEPHSTSAKVVPQIMSFLKDRLFATAIDQGAPHDLAHAVLAAGWEDVVDFLARLDVLRKLSDDPCWPSLVTAVERTHNISRDAAEGVALDPALYSEPLEKELGDIYERNREAIEKLVEERKYEEASRRFAQVFAKPLHAFFDNVFVNVDDQKVRGNRLALLREINRLYSTRIADLSQIVTGVQK